ncbi:hypothetical protein VPH35_016622 [Triticum aestivum]|uniref:KIB1-4 beta-propeller domain-containing protein n=1 Tax=Triticum aestivum TaxID=4565 RepID=A0A3B5ZZK8_WHEAT
MADWPSLPPELIRRIADCILDTNDLDCYVDFRAVCPTWRSATDDPKNSSELRFRPHRWIIIDEVFESHSRLLVNTVSGLVVRKDLPLLGSYFVVATTHGGFFVLGKKEPPHAAVVLNPFTGHMIRFKASPNYVGVCAAALSGLFMGKLPTSSDLSELRSSPTLILLSDRCYREYFMAVPDSVRFSIDAEDVKLYALLRLAAGGGICATDSWQRTAALLPVGLADKIFSLMKLVTDSNELEPVKSIGDRAIFIGHRMCVSVNTHKFPSIVPNCIYYACSSDSSLDIYQYDLPTDNAERVSEGIGSLINSGMSFANPPFTIIQLLSSYTINARASQLAMEKIKPQPQAAATPYLDYWSDSDLDIFW